MEELYFRHAVNSRKLYRKTNAPRMAAEEGGGYTLASRTVYRDSSSTSKPL